MTVNSYDELIEVAKTKENDLDKLRVLQQYFVENVKYNYLMDIQVEIINGEQLIKLKNEGKTKFDTYEEKLQEVLNLERIYGGDKFLLLDIDREKIINNLGKVIEPKEIQKEYGTKMTTLHDSNGGLKIKIRSAYDHGSNGGIIGSILRIPSDESNKVLYNNGLIVSGVCEQFAKFVKNIVMN